MKLSPLPTLPPVPKTGVWYRAVSPGYYPASIFQTGYTANVASRFYGGQGTSPAFETLYLAHSPELALREIEALYGPSGNAVANLRAVTLFYVEVQLQRLVDLTDPAVQSALQTNLQELTGDWRTYSILVALAPTPRPAALAPTQQLGAALFQSGLEGLLAPSAKSPAAQSLVVFPQSLQSGSFIRHIDPGTGQISQV